MHPLPSPRPHMDTDTLIARTFAIREIIDDAAKELSQLTHDLREALEATSEPEEPTR